MIPNISGLPFELIFQFHGTLTSKCTVFGFHANDEYDPQSIFHSPIYHLTLREFTMELWLNVDSFADGQWQVIRNDDAWSSQSIHFQFLGNVLELSRCGTRDHWFKKFAFQSGQWYHIAVTWPNYGLYVDGNLISENKKNINGAAYIREGCMGQWKVFDRAGLGPSGIPRRSYGGNKNESRRFFGKMKEFRVWDCIRTAQEIKDNMLECARREWQKTGLIMYHSLDEVADEITTASFELDAWFGLL